MDYLVTYYIKNMNDGKKLFNIIPYQSSFLSGTENEIFEHATSRLLAEDVFSLSWFFHKPKLRVLVVANVKKDDDSHEYSIGTIPKDWFYTVQTLENDVNKILDELHRKYPDSSF